MMEMTAKIARQREYLQTECGIPVKERIRLLKGLYQALKDMIPELSAALFQDLKKSATESYMTEIGVVLNEIRYMLRHIRRFSRKKRVHTPLCHFPAKSYRLPTAYGMALIISPWNYPVLLSLLPAVDAISAGNTVILKPSESSPASCNALEKLISKTFDEQYVAVVSGGAEISARLLEEDFDYIFYTGGARVGEIVMKKAAEHMTPVTLELGGKSPCIVDETADLKLAARRIVFGKLLNAGQTCIAPDYLFCHESVKEALLAELKSEIIRQYSRQPLSDPDYPGIVNRRQFDRLTELIDPQKVLFGGKSDPKTLKIEPTLLQTEFQDDVMKQEIFGPILPILTFSDLGEAVGTIDKMPRPLALYLFTKSKKNRNFVMTRCRFGGGCVNDTITHLANNRLGFGGIRQSGIGSYRGKAGFDTFTHQKSIVCQANWLDMPMRYHPFTKFKDRLIKFFFH